MASAFGARLRRLREAKGLTLQQVADAVAAQLGVKVDKREIRLETVKQVGVYPLKVRLYPGVEADLTVSVEAQA